MRRILSTGIALAALVATAQTDPFAQRAPSAPRLAVILVVDQMRADYVDRFRGEWTAGLKRLVTSGAWFSNAAYPYLHTSTCAGHATISTGTFPRTHGAIQNEWWDRTEGRVSTCTDDPDTPNIGYVQDAKGGDSARSLGRPTLADRLRAERGARVVSLSIKDRSAIMLAGTGEGAVLWHNGSNWITSSAYGATRVPAIEEYLGAHPVDAYFGQAWTRLLPSLRYHGPDNGEGERPGRGWTATFPHVLAGGSDRPDNVFQEQWERTPFADAYLADMAGVLVERLQLGARDTTDLLAISFSGTDRVGHEFGPSSQEVEDVLVNLDRSLGRLFDTIDARVGRDQYVVALTGDHGVTPIAEQLQRAGKPGGRFDAAIVREAIEKRLQAALGPGKYLAALDGRNLNVYFQPGVYDTVRSRAGLANEVAASIMAIPGIRRVLPSETLRDGAQSTDALVRAAALSFDPRRSGDLVLVLEPGWVSYDYAAIHWNTASLDDRAVPILLIGPGVRPGRYRDAATPADVAPTLAALVGVSMPQAEGHALRSALVAPPAATSTRP